LARHSSQIYFTKLFNNVITYYSPGIIKTFFIFIARVKSDLILEGINKANANKKQNAIVQTQLIILFGNENSNWSSNVVFIKYV